MSGRVNAPRKRWCSLTGIYSDPSPTLSISIESLLPYSHRWSAPELEACLAPEQVTGKEHTACVARSHDRTSSVMSCVEGRRNAPRTIGRIVSWGSLVRGVKPQFLCLPVIQPDPAVVVLILIQTTQPS